MSTVQYGEFIMTDGVIQKVPGQKFKYPKLPAEMRYPNPPLLPKTNPFVYQREAENVAQMNALREYNYQREARRQYNTLRCLYYIQETRRVFKRFRNRISSLFSFRSGERSE